MGFDFFFLFLAVTDRQLIHKSGSGLKLKDISELLGFTRTELTVLSFLIIIFITGFLARLLTTDKLQSKEYDYAQNDSLFLSLPDEDIHPLNAGNDSKGNPEINAAVYDKSLPAEKSIDLNTAGLSQLMQLPGIGPKTAEKIIQLRIEKGGFDSIEEIKEVKGIENKKFDRIKRFIFIEK